MNNRKIVGIGETVLDIVFKNGQPQAAVPGGSTFNAMISLGRTLGRQRGDVEIMMVTQTGKDAVGNMITSFMEKNNLSTKGVDLSEGKQSTVSLALLDECSNATYEFFRDSTMPPFKCPEMSFSPADLVLFGSFFAVSSDTAGMTRGLVRKAHGSGALVYYDINFRQTHISEIDSIRQQVEENYQFCDIVKCSDEDIENLYGTSDAALVYRDHISGKCTTFICTMGSDPAEVFFPLGHAKFGVNKIKVVSTIGAGDNFNAGVLYSLFNKGISSTDLMHMTEEDWKGIIPTAIAFSSNVCQSMQNYVDEGFVPGVSDTDISSIFATDKKDY